jgi:pyridoxal phosphate enzyme (YggS family)
MMERYSGSEAQIAQIAQNVRRVRAELDAAALACGRDPEDVKLLAATKTQPAWAVRAAIRAGAELCGENRAQELDEKWAQGAYEGAELHFIGHLQQNKLKYVVGRCALIHSVDSLPLAAAMDRYAQKLGITQEILLECNIGREASKSGFMPEEILGAAERIFGFSGLKMRGLMVIPPPDGDSAKYFMETSHLLLDIVGKFRHTNTISILSMGMSGDYREAVAAGSHLVRVGSALFGPRQI